MPTADAVEILSRLVRFQSISRRPNADIADFVAAFAASHGAEVERFPSADGTQNSLFMTFGPKVAGGIILSGHMDVVPAGAGEWASDPFDLREANGRLYGRGAVDMKGFLAICLSVAAALPAGRMTRPLHLAFSYEEEVSCEGVIPIVSHIRSSVPDPEAVIVGEPTEMQVVGAHKGAMDWNVEILGKAAHSSRPHLGANAIHAAAMLITEVDNIAQDYARHPSPGASLYDVPYPTLGVGIVHGGSAGNVIPAQCSFQVEARTLEPGQSDAIHRRISEFARGVVLPRMRASAPEADIIIQPRYDIPPLVREPSSAAEQLAGRFASSPSVTAVSYATEAGFFQAAGLPTVVLGPGSIAQAHQTDEYIEAAEFEKGMHAFSRIAQTLF